MIYIYIYIYGCYVFVGMEYLCMYKDLDLIIWHVCYRIRVLYVERQKEQYGS